MSEQILPVLEMRVALTAHDFDRIFKIYTTGLGLEPSADWSGALGRVVVMQMGQATLEILDEQQAASVDQIEAGQRVSGRVRLALRVPDLPAALERLSASGALVAHPPMVTPWGDLNARLEDPEGMQITLFQGD